MAGVREQVKKYIEEEFVHEGDDVDLDLDTVDLLEEEVVDSLGIFALIAFIESKFGVSIDQTDINMDNFATVDTITALIESGG